MDMKATEQRSLLIVDDEENILKSLRRLLRRDGYNIFTANSGKEGLEIAKKEDIGVILSDQRMPEMSGTEFLATVREFKQETVRIVISGYTDLKSIIDAINVGSIYKFLTKPWDDEILRKNIREAFEYYELKQQNKWLTEELQRKNEMLSHDVAETSDRLNFSSKVVEIYQDVVEFLPVGVLGLNEDKTVAFANQAVMRILENIELGAEMTHELSSRILSIDEGTVINQAINGKDYECHIRRIKRADGDCYIATFLPKGNAA